MKTGSLIERMKSALVLSFVMICFVSIASSSQAETHKEMTGVVSKVVINATPEEIFRAIRAYHHSDASKRSVVEEKKGRTIVREKFAGLPVLGDVDCTYEEVETPYTRVDYQLVNSNKLKVFEGNWILQPVEGTKTTLVKLTSYIDSGLSIPAKDFLQHLTAHQDIHKRLAFVKKTAELEQAKHDAEEKKS